MDGDKTRGRFREENGDPLVASGRSWEGRGGGSEDEDGDLMID